MVSVPFGHAVPLLLPPPGPPSPFLPPTMQFALFSLRSVSSSQAPSSSPERARRLSREEHEASRWGWGGITGKRARKRECAERTNKRKEGRKKGRKQDRKGARHGEGEGEKKGEKNKAGGPRNRSPRNGLPAWPNMFGVNQSFLDRSTSPPFTASALMFSQHFCPCMCRIH